MFCDQTVQAHALILFIIPGVSTGKLLSVLRLLRMVSPRPQNYQDSKEQ